MNSRLIIILTFCCLYTGNIVPSALSITNNSGGNIKTWFKSPGKLPWCVNGEGGGSGIIEPGKNFYINLGSCDFENIVIEAERKPGEKGFIKKLYVSPVNTKYWYVGLIVNADETVTSDSKAY